MDLLLTSMFGSLCQTEIFSFWNAIGVCLSLWFKKDDDSNKVTLYNVFVKDRDNYHLLMLSFRQSVASFLQHAAVLLGSAVGSAGLSDCLA